MMKIALFIDAPCIDEHTLEDLFLYLPQPPYCGRMFGMQKEYLARYHLPDTPGVYIFKKGRSILYIGKAASLRDRVRSYFSADLVRGRGERIVHMVAEATTLSHKATDSVLEALILEADLIKKHQPPYNIDEKDDKSFNYVVITNEEFPRVLLVRGRELFQKWEQKAITATYGPFPHGTQLQEALKIVRRIFPFCDAKCVPCGTPQNAACRPCFNHQIGLCPGVCTGEVSKSEYARTIRNIRDLFEGTFHGLKRRLAREMRVAAKAENFERASVLRRQVHALEHIRDVSLIKADLRVAAGGLAVPSMAGRVRVEAYDVAHTAGAQTVGVMTVVSSGEALRSAYRKFKVCSATNDDVAALKEILSRRLAHTEWPLPRVFVVDGGMGQMRAAQRILKEAGLLIPLVGVVKNESHKPQRIIGDIRAARMYEREILLANHEAHRFAVSYHRARRGKLVV